MRIHIVVHVIQGISSLFLYTGKLRK